MNKILTIVFASALTSCASFQNNKEAPNDNFTVESSYLEIQQSKSLAEGSDPKKANENGESQYNQLTPLSEGYKAGIERKLEKKFSDQDKLSVAVDSMPLIDFLHYSLGEQLHLNYVLANDLPPGSPITLNIRDALSSRRFFSLIQDVLAQRSMQITEKDDVYYVVRTASSSKGAVAIGIGSSPDDVPNTATQIFQIVPTSFGISTTLERTIGQLVDAEVTPDFQQNTLFIKGRREEVLRAVELVELLDMPLNRGKQVGIVKLVYTSAEDFIAQARLLLQNEGVSVGVGAGVGQNIVFVPLLQLGAVAVFSSDKTLVERVKYWSRQIDKPATNSEAKYYLYSPQFARAADLGESLAPLINQQSGSRTKQNNVASVNASSDAANSGAASKSNNRTVVASNPTLSMVVDERSNSLIFYGSGSEYQAIEPLIYKLDVLPKQVLLDITVAEVTLTGVFKQGVEFAIANASGDKSSVISTLGSFGLDKIAGLSYTFGNLDTNVVAKLFQGNTHVNILSKPTLVVRDGVAASLSIGTDVPIISSSTVGSDIDTRNTTQFQYRKTGLELDVKPTVNAQNIVLMEIKQFLSTQPDADVSSSNPSFFERQISTEVVARSGQTILLGGIISENKNFGNSKIPLLGDIPLLGNLFKGENNTNEKTELVILVTARVLDNTDEWQSIKESFQKGLESINIAN